MRLIDADETIRAITSKFDESLSVGDAIETIDSMPSAQPEIIRCKDCEYLEVLNGNTYYARCNWHGMLFESFGGIDTRTWFCADAERAIDLMLQLPTAKPERPKGR